MKHHYAIIDETGFSTIIFGEWFTDIEKLVKHTKRKFKRFESFNDALKWLNETRKLINQTKKKKHFNDDYRFADWARSNINTAYWK